MLDILSVGLASSLVFPAFGGVICFAPKEAKKTGDEATVGHTSAVILDQSDHYHCS